MSQAPRSAQDGLACPDLPALSVGPVRVRRLPCEAPATSFVVGQVHLAGATHVDWRRRVSQAPRSAQDGLACPDLPALSVGPVWLRRLLCEAPATSFVVGQVHLAGATHVDWRRRVSQALRSAQDSLARPDLPALSVGPVWVRRLPCEAPATSFVVGQVHLAGATHVDWRRRVSVAPRSAQDGLACPDLPALSVGPVWVRRLPCEAPATSFVVGQVHLAGATHVDLRE